MATRPRATSLAKPVMPAKSIQQYPQIAQMGTDEWVADA